MPAPTLSPAAQRQFDELTPAIVHGRNWNFDYIGFLDRLSMRELPDVSVVEVRNQGLEAWERSREELSVALELKEYAANELVSFFGEVNTTSLPLIEFIESLISRPRDGKSRECEFRDFLCSLAESELIPRDQVTMNHKIREDRIAEMGNVRWDFLESEGVSRFIQSHIKNLFTDWRKQNHPHVETAAIKAKRANKADKMEKMKSILRKSNRTNEGLTSIEWERQALDRLDIPSTTFRRHQKALVASGEVVVANGKYRIPKKSPEKR